MRQYSSGNSIGVHRSRGNECFSHANIMTRERFQRPLSDDAIGFRELIGGRLSEGMRPFDRRITQAKAEGVRSAVAQGGGMRGFPGA